MVKHSVVFLGSGPVAAESLHLLSEAFTIEAIVTKPTTTAMMQAACPTSPLYTVEKRRDLDELVANKKFTSACGILIDFGIIVSNKTISSFPKGIINSHFSLLPEWRGADPITFAILSGQKTTGVSIMLLSEGMDEGPLLAQATCDVP
ncbi:MAG: formyltransferase family protein, partial [Candidatus Micrarchaeaceae archaeon]